MTQWKTPPSGSDLERDYLAPSFPLLEPILSRAEADSIASDLQAFDWETYRSLQLRLDPGKEEKRLRQRISEVENLLNTRLEGNAILFGAFLYMDGYARFDQGTHNVFLGVDESHEDPTYLDILITHELTHVARESSPEVWEGFGLNPKMTQSEFTELQPVIEHLMGEGFSCAISEILVPNESPWKYCYQTPESLAHVLKNSSRVNEVIHAEISKKNGDYGNLYNPRYYGDGFASFTQYVWAWQWAKTLIADQSKGKPALILNQCSNDFISHAMQFQLGRKLV